MKEKIKNICDLTVRNYRTARMELRYDGDYINHLAALIYAMKNSSIKSESIKSIRSEIKNKTSRVSSFRGDILYIVSILISLEDNIEGFIDEFLNTFDQLLELGFRDSQYLVISAYALVKNSKEYKVYENELKMKEIYSLMRSKYHNVTNHEDYLECALIALDNNDVYKTDENMNKCTKLYGDIKSLSNNSVQALSMASILNKREDSLNKVKKLYMEMEKDDKQINHQFLSLFASCAGSCNEKSYVRLINEIIRYLCDEEGEYQFYMDRGFRIAIAMVILETGISNGESRYIDELLCKGVYSLIISKNQDSFKKVLA